MSAAAAWTLQVLGPVRLHGPAAPGAMVLGRKAQAVLAWLAARGGEAAARRSLVDLLWLDSAEGDANNALRQCLFQMRRSMGDAHPLRATRDTLALDAARLDVDLWRFLALARSEDPGERIAACALYGGDFACDVAAASAFDAWAAGERARLRELAGALAERCAHEVRDVREIEVVADLAGRIVAADPLHEGCWRALMVLHARAGQRAKVEAVWHQCRRTLRLHAACEPADATRALHDSFAAQVATPVRATVHLSLGRHAAPPPHPDDAEAAAHDHASRALYHYFNGSAEDNAAARAGWDAASRLVPGRCSWATLAAWTHFTDFNYEFNGSAAVNYLLAASKCRLLMKRFPRDGLPVALDGKLRLWRGDFAGALDAFGRALAMDPQTPSLWANMADALMRAGRPHDALDHIRVATDLQPQDRGYFPFVAGNVHFALGDLDAALAAYQSSVRRNPEYCISFRGIGAVQAVLGRHDEAREAMRHARLAPVMRSALHVLGPYAEPDLTRRWAKAWLRAGMRAG